MWLYEGKEVGDDIIPDGHIGFVYIITNLTNNKRYIGKKLLKNTRTKTIKGKKKKVVSTSDWKGYWGSNSILKEDVKKLGEHNFKREILRFCKTKGTANYWEAKLQFVNGVLGSDEWYNEWALVKVSKIHIKESLTNQFLSDMILSWLVEEKTP